MAEAPADGPALPLAGVRVVEIGTSVAAPYGTWILAALGAEVVKVERPGRGDDARHWGPPFWHGAAAFFPAMNRDKRSVTVDLTDDGQRAWLRGYLEREADVVLQNMRPGVVTRMSKPFSSWAIWGAWSTPPKTQ